MRWTGENALPSCCKDALDKYQFLPRQDRAFIKRVCEGTVEYGIQNDYIINQYSKIKINKCKPVIRAILRMSVYQIRFLDAVPDSAVVNEAVKLAEKKHFYNLKGFVNGVLRTIVREKIICRCRRRTILRSIFP